MDTERLSQSGAMMNAAAMNTNDELRKLEACLSFLGRAELNLMRVGTHTM
jgi:hypothetical protein